MNTYSIPVIGWIVGAFFHTCLAIPFYFIWNALAPTYFYWLPNVFHQIDFWDCVGLFIVISILKSVILPTFSSSSSSSSD